MFLLIVGLVSGARVVIGPGLTAHREEEDKIELSFQSSNLSSFPAFYLRKILEEVQFRAPARSWDCRRSPPR